LEVKGGVARTPRHPAAPARAHLTSGTLLSVMTTHSFQSRSRRADSHGPAPRVQRLGVASSLI